MTRAMTIRAGAILLGITVLPAVVGCAPQGAEYDTAALASGDPDAGAELYAFECASCHGVSGEGSAAGTPLAGELQSMTDDKIWWVVVYGADGMPSYPELTDEDIGDLIAFMRAAF